MQVILEPFLFKLFWFNPLYDIKNDKINEPVYSPDFYSNNFIGYIITIVKPSYPNKIN